MIIRHTVKSCCGKTSYILETPKPIKKSQVTIFEGAGYTAPLVFKQCGTFYVRNSFIIATAAYGSNKINIRCSGSNCDQNIDDFVKLLELAIEGHG